MAQSFVSRLVSFRISIRVRGKTYTVNPKIQINSIDDMLIGCNVAGKMAHENGSAALEKEPDFFAPAFNNSDSLVGPISQYCIFSSVLTIPE